MKIKFKKNILLKKSITNKRIDFLKVIAYNNKKYKGIKLKGESK